MKYIKSYKIFESVAIDTAKIKEALEIYAEDLPFELSDFDVASHIDTKDAKTIIYSVLCSYEFADLDLTNDLDTKYYVTRTEIEEQISKSFNKFAKKYDMECHNIMVDIELPDDAGDNTDINVTFDLIQKLETFSNVTALEEALELYSEGLPFEMRNVYVSNKTQYDFDNQYDIYEISYEHIEPSEAGNINVKKHADAAFSKFAKRYDMEYVTPYSYHRPWHGEREAKIVKTITGAIVDIAHDDDNNIVPYVTFSLKQIRGKKSYNPRPHNESISDFDCDSLIQMLLLQLEDNGEFELVSTQHSPGIMVSNTISLDDYQSAKDWFAIKGSLPTEEYIRSHSKSHSRKGAKDTDIPTSILIYQDYSNNPEMCKFIEQHDTPGQRTGSFLDAKYSKSFNHSQLIEEKAIEITTKIFNRLGKKFDIKFDVVGAYWSSIQRNVEVEILMYDEVSKSI